MDLLRRYSNRSDLLIRLRETCQLADEQGFYERLAPALTVSARPVKAWRVRDRLTDDDVQALIADFLAGVIKRELAERYEVSLSTVKNILRKHGARRQLKRLIHRRG